MLEASAYRGWSPLWVGPWVVLGYVRKQAEETKWSQPVSSTPSGLCFRSLSSSSVIDCNQDCAIQIGHPTPRLLLVMASTTKTGNRREHEASEGVTRTYTRILFVSIRESKHHRHAQELAKVATTRKQGWAQGQRDNAL